MARAVGEQLQISNATSFMRYAPWYSRIAAGLLTGPSPRVLVFGCSTGAELRTVRHFWPDAAIWGCDIDEDVLDTARHQAPFAQVFRSSAAAIRDLGAFDLVCANSVLCRHPFPRTGFDLELPFARFAGYLDLLLSALKPGGYLLACNTNHFVQDTEAGATLAPITIAEEWSAGFVPRVDRAGQVVAHPAVLDGQLRRYLVPGDLDPFARMRSALFRNGAGPTLALLDRIALPRGSATAAGAPLPAPSHDRAFEPFVATVPTAAGPLSTVYLHNPATGDWDLHGSYLAGGAR